MIERFPPSFHDIALLYGGALFGVTVLFVLNLAVLAEVWWKAYGLGYARPNILWLRPSAVRAPLAAYRFQKVCVALAFCIGVGPDALYLLAWGEASYGTMRFLFYLDRGLDFLAAIPGSFAVISGFSNVQQIEHRLEFGGTPQGPNYRPKIFSSLYTTKKLKLILYSFTIAMGVTFAKATL